VSDTLGDRLRSLVGSDIYSIKGRLRSDDMLVRERVGHGLGEADARLRELVSRWRADRVPPSTREQPFPPASVMEPVRNGERLCRAIEDCSSAVRGLPVLNADRVWDRVRGVGLDELMQFDWALVGESDALATELAGVPELEGGGRGGRGGPAAADPRAHGRPPALPGNPGVRLRAGPGIAPDRRRGRVTLPDKLSAPWLR
jgi:hypothetical protein